MKKLLLPFVLLLATATAHAQVEGKPVGGTGPMISVDKDVHDYGTIAQGANGECTFTVTNTGDAPLIITNCKGSCGCTVPKCDTEPIKPGGKSAITVRYDTKRTGPINKSVTITSNATNAPDKVVRIKGMVEGSAAAPATN
ncbi:MAG: DUF1573 domain-containing protein [Flavobacteriales bacterium]|jgi:hypothetical protein|nr:MAG: DUF1573 domain-containing protein [Flavobacteriales bacterium]